MEDNLNPEFSTPLIGFSLNEGILTLSIQRGEKKNAITRDMYRGLHTCLQAAEFDARVRVVVITGHDGNFTAGNDISDFLHHPPSDETSPVLLFLKTLSQFTKPLIAAADGVAIGVGTTLLLHCDIVVVHQDVKLKLPFVELGLCPEAASSLLLPRIIGYQRAAQMILMSDLISGQQALEWGLVNYISTEPALPMAIQHAKRIASLPMESLTLSKKLLKSELTAAIDARLTIEAKHFIERLASTDAREAFTAFIQKRPAKFNL